MDLNQHEVARRARDETHDGRDSFKPSRSPLHFFLLVREVEAARDHGGKFSGVRRRVVDVRSTLNARMDHARAIALLENRQPLT
jgi:hypothetical protein